jgi:hypothetical protein
MLIRGVVENQFSDDPQATLVGVFQKSPEVIESAVSRVNCPVVRYVVAVVAQRGTAKRHQPESRHSQILEVFELLAEPFEIADTVSVAVEEAFDMQLVNDGVLVPERISVCANDCAR